MASEGVEDTANGGVGEKEVDVNNIKIEEWLDENRLSKYKDAMQKDQVVVQDFLSYNDNEIQLHHTSPHNQYSFVTIFCFMHHIQGSYQGLWNEYLIWQEIS